MKTSRLLLLGCLALGGLVAGCQRVPGPPDPRVVLAPEVRHSVYVSQFMTFQNQAGLTQIQANLRNLRNRALPLQFRVDWFDANGIAQESLTSSWRAISITRMTEYALKVTAPNAQATDFRMYIHSAQGN